MSISLDQIVFYQPPTSGGHQLASQGRGQQSGSTRSSITEKVAVHSAIGSRTHHGAANSSIDTAGLPSGVHVETVGNVLVQRDSTSSRINSDAGFEKIPSIPVEEPTAPGTTAERRTAGAPATRLSTTAQKSTTFRPFTPTEAPTDSSLKLCHKGERQANTTASQFADDRAEVSPQTTPETHSGEAILPPGREKQTVASSGSLTGTLPAKLKGSQSQSASNKQIKEGFELVTTVPGMSDTTLQSTEDDPMCLASPSSMITSPRETGYGVITTGVCRAVQLRNISEVTTVTGSEQQLGDSEEEAEPEVTAEPLSTGVMSSPTPRQIVGFDNAARVSSTAPPSPAPSTSAPPSPAPPTPALRRSRRAKASAGSYAEVDSDTESNTDGDATMSSDDDRPFGRRWTPLGSLGQRSNKRRNPSVHGEYARESSASKRFRRSQQTSTNTSDTTRRSRRIAEHTAEMGVRSPPRSESASDEEQSANHVLAMFDEFPLPFAPLNNFVLKRTIVGHVTTFTLEWQQVNAHSRCQDPPEVDRRYSPSLPEPAPASVPTGSRRMFSKKENQLLRDLKQQGIPWKEIHEQFSEKYPGRSVGTLQVHYSTKLKNRSN